MYHVIIALAVACAAIPCAPATAQVPKNADAHKEITGRGHPRLSPFSAMRREGDAVHVEVDGDTWFELVSIEGITAKELVDRTTTICGRKAWERITEDLVEVLTVLNGHCGDTVALELKRLDDGEIIEVAKAEMTRENRQRLLRANRDRDDEDDDRAKRSALTLDGALDDLAMLRVILDTRFSYRHRTDVDLDAMIEQAADRLRRGEFHPDLLAREVDAILRAFGDGHTRLRSGTGRVPGYLPFLIDRADGGYVAFHADRSGLMDADRPYVVSIDGIPIEKWIEAARARVPPCSDHFRDRMAVRELRNLTPLREALGVDPTAVGRLVVRGKRAKPEELVFDASPTHRPIYGEWPRDKRHELLDGNIGYLRIPGMTSDPEFLDGLDAAMKSFEKTEGLIIDVRGNGGGTRTILRHLFPYFMKESDAPHVANIAAYRTPSPNAAMPDDGFLANRWLYPESWSGWTPAQRKSVRAAQRRFKPEWKLPRNAFSDWHYFVLDRSMNEAAFTYGRPVVVLLDENCFSATDIFLGAFKGWRGVTLLGTASGGGSGRSRGYTLRNSGLEIRVSSMASFRPNGKLYEGRGIRPDLVVERAPEDLVEGDSDRQLAAALERLR